MTPGLEPEEAVWALCTMSQREAGQVAKAAQCRKMDSSEWIGTVMGAAALGDRHDAIIDEGRSIVPSRPRNKTRNPIAVYLSLDRAAASLYVTRPSPLSAIMEILMFRALVVAVAVFAAQAVTSAHAQSDYPFKLHNRSQGWTITGFQTFMNGSWSTNWLSAPVPAGQAVNMDWKSNAGSCTVRFRVQWAGYDPTEHRADFCNLKNLYMLNEGIRTD